MAGWLAGWLQIAALWDELHTRAPWRNVVGGKPLKAFNDKEDAGEQGGGEGGNGTRLLAFLGVNTVGGWVGGCHRCSAYSDVHCL